MGMVGVGGQVFREIYEKQKVKLCQQLIMNQGNTF